MPTTAKRLLALLICLNLLLLLAACGAVPSPSPTTGTAPSPAATSDVTPTESPDPAKPSPDPTPSNPGSDSPDSAVTATPQPTEDPVPTISLPVYEFGTPLAERNVVEDSYFDNAVFLGDSRTEGLQIFGGLPHGDYYWARGMTVFRVDDPKYAIFDVDGELLTMIGALGKKEYASVYIMIGVNELGYDAATYESGLALFIDQVLAAQPNAVIYLQTLPPVNESVARQNGLADYINNKRINQFNEAIVRIAGEKKVVLLDTAQVYRNESGELPAELASDGCHFNFNGYTRWTDYLRCHVMDAETYHYNRSLEPSQIPDPEPTEAPVPEPSPEPDETSSPAPSAEPSEEPTEEPGSPQPTEEVTEA